MNPHTRQRRAFRQVGLWIVLLMAMVLLVGVSGIGAQARQVRVALLTTGLSSNLVLEGLREGLAQLGYHEGKDIAFLVEDVQGDVTSLASRATKIVEAKPDLIFTVGTSPAVAAKQATTTLPILFAFVGDPLRSDLVASYASSQDNLTGIATYSAPLSGKRLEILQEIAPRIKRVLVLMAPQHKGAEASFPLLVEAASKLGIELLYHDVDSKQEIEQTLNTLPKGAVDAICLVPSSLVAGKIDLLIHKAKQDRIPLVVHEESRVERGALVSYGAGYRLLGRQAAKLVIKVVKGGKPSEIPIQTPEQQLLTINLTTAKTIGLDIPRSILERTDHLVE